MSKLLADGPQPEPVLHAMDIYIPPFFYKFEYESKVGASGYAGLSRARAALLQRPAMDVMYGQSLRALAVPSQQRASQPDPPNHPSPLLLAGMQEKAISRFIWQRSHLFAPGGASGPVALVPGGRAGHGGLCAPAAPALLGTGTLSCTAFLSSRRGACNA